MASFGRSAHAALYRKDVKRWGDQRVHPAVSLSGRQGETLASRLLHFVDRDISDMLQRLDRYTTARAQDLRESGDIGSYGGNLRRIVSRFWKCYIIRKGYREGLYGFLGHKGIIRAMQDQDLAFDVLGIFGMRSAEVAVKTGDTVGP